MLQESSITWQGAEFVIFYFLFFGNAAREKKMEGNQFLCSQDKTELSGICSIKTTNQFTLGFRTNYS